MKKHYFCSVGRNLESPQFSKCCNYIDLSQSSNSNFSVAKSFISYLKVSIESLKFAEISLPIKMFLVNGSIF